MKNSNFIEKFDIDELTNNKTVDQQLNYIFIYIGDLLDEKEYELIDESICIFLKNGVDFKLDVLIAFLTICYDNKHDIKKYNNLYHYTFLRCQQIMDENDIKTYLNGLISDDYYKWIRSMKINKINDRIK